MTKSLSLLLKIFLPLVAVAGIGGGSWYIYEETNPTIFKAFSKKGYSWSPVSFEGIKVSEKFGINTSSAKLNGLFSPRDCVNKFFPGLKWISKGFERTENEETENKATVGSLPTFSNHDKSIGCLVFQIGNNPNTSVSEGLANWELTLKKGDHGMIMMGYAYDSIYDRENSPSGTNSYEFRWMGLHLKKENSKWEIKGGAMWDDFGAGQNYSSQKLTINFPQEKAYEWEIRSNTSCKIGDSSKVSANTTCVGPSKWKYFGFSSIWEESLDGKGQEIFEIIKQSFGSTEGDIWGKKEFDFAFNSETHGTNSRGWASTHTILANPDEGWKNTKTGGGDYKDYLTTLYSPFKGKKGTWTETDKFCEKQKNLRANQNNETIEKVVSFCFNKK